MKEIVIKLSDLEYNQLIYGDDGLDYEILEQATVNGTVLPEHGKLGDLDELYKKVQNEDNDTEDEKSMKALFRYLIRQADTILESDMVEPQESEGK